MILVLVSIALFIIWLVLMTRKPKNFPPGPPRLPFIGGIPYMIGSMKKPSMLYGLEENVKKYGPIFGYYFGQTPAVVLADFDMIKEAFKSEHLAARPSLEPVNEVRPGKDCFF
jgi:hypothetical protein